MAWALPLGRAYVTSMVAHRPAADVGVDRGGEDASLRAGVEALRHGGGAAVWVEGEPGIGKSSLVVEALAGTSELGWDIGWGIADQLAERLPLSVMQDCLQVRVDSPTLAARTPPASAPQPAGSGCSPTATPSARRA